MQTLEPRTRLWTREEYYRLAEDGYFQDQRVERIGGEILNMSPQLNQHYAGISAAAEALAKVFTGPYWIRTQAPLYLGEDSDPEPDVAVVKGTRKDFQDHPATALLIVEVSGTTLNFDRGRKASLYAHAGIKDYWILNLNDRALEVRRKPVQDAAQPFGWRYAEAAVLDAAQRVSPLALPKAKIAVADLLP